MSKIYTKTGDQGITGLYGGERVSKTDPRIIVNGEIDELNAHIGMLCGLLPDSINLPLLVTTQENLFNLGANLDLTDNAITELEQSIDAMTASLPELKHFILPSGHPAANAAHIARTVCRRAERAMVASGKSSPYLNRLSDWLFTLARYINVKTGHTETLWLPKK